MVKRSLQLQEETRAIALENKDDLREIKQMIMPRFDDRTDDAGCLSEPAETINELDELCQKLDNRPFRKTVVGLTIILSYVLFCIYTNRSFLSNACNYPVASE